MMRSPLQTLLMIGLAACAMPQESSVGQSSLADDDVVTLTYLASPRGPAGTEDITVYCNAPGGCCRWQFNDVLYDTGFEVNRGWTRHALQFNRPCPASIRVHSIFNLWNGRLYWASDSAVEPDSDELEVTTHFRAGLAVGRAAHSASNLADGGVLLAGGYSGSGAGPLRTYLSSAEIYDPDNNTSSATGSLQTARANHSAVILDSGQVMVISGYNSSDFELASVELFDPSTQTWSQGPSLEVPRRFFTATRLLDGRILVAGGLGGPDALASAEVFDPTSGHWQSTGALNTARYHHAASVLPDGTVLVSGGTDGSTALASAEIFDPVGGMWAATGSLSYARVSHTQTALPNGQLLIAGGGGSAYPAVAELYNPATGSFSPTGSLSSPRQEHTATLDDGVVLIIGGNGPDLNPLAAIEAYDPTTGLFSSLPPLEEARFAHTAVSTPLRSLLVAGGDTGGTATSGTGELY